MTMTTPQVPATGQQLLSTLNQQWYNAVTQALNLDETKFQLIQGSMAVQPNSSTLWSFFDAIPPLSLTQKFDPSGYNSLFSTYNSVINNLVPQTDDSLQTLLGDKYVSWLNYRTNAANLPNPLPKTASGQTDYVAAQVQMFETWGIANLDSDKIGAGTTLLQQADVVSVALTMLVAAKAAAKAAGNVGTNEGGYAYTATYGKLKYAIQQRAAKSVSMNSESQSADTSHAWAGGRVSGFADFFSGDAGGSWDQFHQQISSSGLTVSVNFGAVTTLPGQPLATPQPTDPDLSSAVPWWSSAALQVARQHNDNTVWKHGAPTWDDTFGPDGSLNRLSTGVIVVDGITSTITTNFSVSSDDASRMKAAMKFGFWPFFSASGEGGWDHSVTSNSNGTATLTSTCPAGNPNILGVLVDPINVVLGGS